MITIKFFCKFGIPWFIHCDFDRNSDDLPPTLFRNIYAKWWDPYKIYIGIQPWKKLQIPASSPPVYISQFDKLKQKMKQELSEGTPFPSEEVLEEKLEKS
eukprot:TRINITY_DN29406_c0_g1_i1.p1 TRINITY_DN29406_c0_g1~~TRINITY_DN29406_c0_g1_i1.p1  ORF type:complete len:100 (-),score=22.40 TRINITY_DN29406_c0_g1_i1:264-563(-)